MDKHLIIFFIIIGAGLLGGFTNFFILYHNKLDRNESWIKLVASILVSLCASFTVPLFLQILSNDLLDHLSFKNCLIFIGFCVLASFFSKRFLEDVYAKIGKLNDKLEQAKKETEDEFVKVSKKTEDLKVKTANLEEAVEEDEEITPELIEVIDQNGNTTFIADKGDIKKVIQAFFNGKYSFRTINGIAKEIGVTIETISYILDILKKYGFAESKLGAQGKTLWRILKHPILIYSANYGVAGKFVDVTLKIKELVSKNIFEGTVSPAQLGVSDPAYGTVKQLRIHCRIKGVERELAWNDGEKFKIE